MTTGNSNEGHGCELPTGNTAGIWIMISASVLEEHLGSAHSIRYSLTSRMLYLSPLYSKGMFVTLELCTEISVYQNKLRIISNLHVGSISKNMIAT